MIRYEPDRGRTCAHRGDRRPPGAGRPPPRGPRALDRRTGSAAPPTPRSSASSSPTRSSTPCRRTASSVAADGSARSWSAGTTATSSTSRPTRRHRPSRRALAAEGIALADDQRAEICLELDAWMARAASGLDRGILLIVDYGYPAAELYDPVRRHDGTLRAYLRHTVHDDPYVHVGRQDLTAHVDVTAVEAAATRRRPRPSRDHDPGSSSPGSAPARALQAARHRPGDDDGGLPHGAFGAPPDDRSGGHGPLPRRGVRSRLARRPAARRLRLPDAALTHPPRRPRRDHLHRTAPHCTTANALLLPDDGPTARFTSVGHDLIGERRADLHARSARAAPRRNPTPPDDTPPDTPPRSFPR